MSEPIVESSETCLNFRINKSGLPLEDDIYDVGKLVGGSDYSANFQCRNCSVTCIVASFGDIQIGHIENPEACVAVPAPVPAPGAY